MFRRTVLAFCGLLLTLPLLATTSPAVAATSAPTGLSAGVPSALTIPTLSWDRVPEATTYTVEVHSSNAFTSGSLLWSTTTYNVNAVPTKQLPTGQLWFRVRATGPTGSSEWSTMSFSRQKAPGPRPTYPADGATLHQPDDPVLVAWAPVQGAENYVVELSSDQGFTDPTLVKSYETQTTTLVRPDQQAARPYYWRVSAVLGDGITTNWSTVRSYVLAPLPAAELVSPADGSTTTVDDVALDWQPVTGATSYDVEVSLVPDFSQLVTTQTRVVGTRWSPPVTLDNNQYYWRVRARDVFGNLQGGGDVSTWRFRRAWPDQPQLQYPADGATVGAPFYYQWSPVKLASRYQLELTNTSGTPVTRTCITDQTTFTPAMFGNASNKDCWPDAGGTYTWRVLALDDPASPPVQTDPVSAQVGSFSYHPGLVQPLSPVGNAQVTVPTLRWTPHPGAAAYRVTVTNVTSGTSTTLDTAATSFTPRTKLVTGDYRWSVRWIAQDGRIGPTVGPDVQPTFTLVAPPSPTASTPEPTLAPATYDRFPTLTWTPVPGATHYKLLVRPVDGITETTLSPTYAFPAGEDATEQFLKAGDYEWRVQAWNSGVYLSTSTSAGRFTIAERKAVTGQKIALSGTDTGNPLTSCALTTPSSCEGVRNTPVLRWDSEPNTGYYKVYLSYDRELTNLVGKNDGYPTVFPITTTNTMFVPSDSLPEADAGTAYFWTVQPCSVNGVCRPLEYPVNSFNKLGHPVKPLSPGVAWNPNGNTSIPRLPDDITFTWQDYLATNQSASTNASTLKTQGRSEARQYRIQVADNPQFSNSNGKKLLDSVLVDQTTFTSYANTYPDTQLYWRVQAVDGGGRALPWSPVWTFEKKSPAPAPLDPVGDISSGGTPYDGSTPLRWAPLDYAAGYDVEIYRDYTGDPSWNPDPSNLVDEGTVAQTAVSWRDPVGPAATPYAWRVRRVDAKARRGDWSPWSGYRVSADSVMLSGPAVDASVAPAEGLFTWQPVAGAASYRWERRLPGSATTTDSIPTVATAYAPTAVLGDGNWQWRVAAYDTAGQLLNRSDWRSFSVIGGPTATAAPTIDGTGVVGTMLTSSDPSWDFQGVTNYYQWMRGLSPIAGATSPSYEVTSLDVGKAVSLKVTGRKPGYRDVVTTSTTSITGVTGPAPTTKTAPSITGSGRVGETLTATSATWNEQGVTESYAWLRDGRVIFGEETTTYELVGGDAGKDITFRVTGEKPGYADAVVASNSIRGVPGDASVVVTPPAVTGVATVGETLEADHGTWSPVATTYRYQWLRNGAPILGATRSIYRPVGEDAGKPVLRPGPGAADRLRGRRRHVGGRAGRQGRVDHRREVPGLQDQQALARRGRGSRELAGHRGTDRQAHGQEGQQHPGVGQAHRGQAWPGRHHAAQAPEGQAQAEGHLQRQRPGGRIDLEDDHPDRHPLTSGALGCPA